MQYLGTWVGSGAFLVGHSQGGLISRVASRSHAVDGILTIGTPHGGAPIAGHVDDASAWFTFLGMSSAVAYSGLHAVANDPWHPHNSSAVEGLDAAGFLSYYMGIGIGAFLAFADQFNNAALDDLVPGSSFHSTLASQVANETGTGRRRAIHAEADGGYLGGPLRLAFDAVNADAIGQLINIASYNAIVAGVSIEVECSPAEDNWIDHQIGAAALFDIGLQLGDLPAWWSYDIVGGYPSDIILPVTRQMTASFTPIAEFGLVHGEQTTKGKTALWRELTSMQNQ